MNLCNLTAAITAAANMLAGCYNKDQLALLGMAFNQLGDTLSILAYSSSDTICDTTTNKTNTQ